MSETVFHIAFPFSEGPWGGANQFLQALRAVMRKREVYAERLSEADAVLINSHHFGNTEYAKCLLQYLNQTPNIKVIHRLDGPISLIRGVDNGTDDLIIEFNKYFADGTIIQSKWCFERCSELGLDGSKPHEIILNAPNPEYFYKKPYSALGEKISIIATSWSSNKRKGFDVYQWLDKNLDWRIYTMTFVGNSALEFENINSIMPVGSKELGCILRDHDIFLTASRSDPCSNALIEALHCGLPAIVRNDGGHPEIVGGGGLAFNEPEEIPNKLNSLSKNYERFSKSMQLNDIQFVCDKYIEFMEKVMISDYHAPKTKESAKKCFKKYNKIQIPRMHGRFFNKIRHSLGR